MQRQQGFLLGYQSRDSHHQTELVLWVKTKGKPAKLIIFGEQPVFFVKDSHSDVAVALLKHAHIYCKTVKLPLKNFTFETVTAFYFSTMQLARRGAQRLIEKNIDPLEADIRLIDRFLMERFIYGGVEFIGLAKEHDSFIEYKNVKIKAAQVETRLNYAALDIECSEKGELYCIGLASHADSRVLMIGQASEKKTDISIDYYANEALLLDGLNHWMQTFDPDVLLGWNVVDFDFRLLVKRAALYGKKLLIGRGGEAAFWREGSNQQGFITVPGRVVIDGIDALKSATYGFSSWSLDFVAHHLLGEGKAIDNVYQRMESINRMFYQDKVALAKYNLQDCHLVNRIFEQCHLLEFLVERTKLTGIELNKLGGSVAAFTNLYLPKLHRAGFVAPSLITENWIASPGGYVMQSKAGLYDSVLVLDFKSLYPAIIRTFLIDPMGLIEGLRCHEMQASNALEHTVAGFRESFFHREKHFLPELIAQLWQARDSAKQQGEAAFSQAIKIIMNSFYGVLGSAGCRFYDHRLASSITLRGHEIMKETRHFIEQRKMEVIYGDTDSTFVSLGKKYTNQEANAIGYRLVADINQFWTQRLKEKFQLDSKLEIEYETHYQRFLMPKIRSQELGSKKRYAGLMVKNGKQQMVFKGLETVRADWTVLAQEFQQKLYQKVFNSEDVTDYVQQIVKETLAGKNTKKLIYRKRLRRHLSAYQKNIPPHVKAAKKADEYNAKKGRPLQYQKGGYIEYVITVEGPEPLEAQFSQIDFQHYVDKQLKPIADAILPFIEKDFSALTLPQLGLF